MKTTDSANTVTRGLIASDGQKTIFYDGCNVLSVVEPTEPWPTDPKTGEPFSHVMFVHEGAMYRVARPHGVS